MIADKVVVEGEVVADDIIEDHLSNSDNLKWMSGKI
jgi:hypothetical protein